MVLTMHRVKVRIREFHMVRDRDRARGKGNA